MKMKRDSGGSGSASRTGEASTRGDSPSPVSEKTGKVSGKLAAAVKVRFLPCLFSFSSSTTHGLVIFICRSSFRLLFALPNPLDFSFPLSPPRPPLLHPLRLDPFPPYRSVTSRPVRRRRPSLLPTQPLRPSLDSPPPLFTFSRSSRDRLANLSKRNAAAASAISLRVPSSKAGGAASTGQVGRPLFLLPLRRGRRRQPDSATEVQREGRVNHRQSN